jgi:hypothetical protein
LEASKNELERLRALADQRAQEFATQKVKGQEEANSASQEAALARQRVELAKQQAEAASNEVVTPLVVSNLYGRAFDVLAFVSRGIGGQDGLILSRPERPAPSEAELGAPEPGEEREAARRLGVDPAAGQRLVQAAVAAAEHRLQGQRRHRGHRRR